jgi:hypothetical protein
MADDPTLEQTPEEAERAQTGLDEPLPAPADPGGAHAKGYSADPRPEPAVSPDGPLPLAPGPDTHPAVRVPERDHPTQATGRSGPHDYTPNDRLMGADR